jgi:hypothetical protein
VTGENQTRCQPSRRFPSEKHQVVKKKEQRVVVQFQSTPSLGHNYQGDKADHISGLRLFRENG